MIKKKEKYKKNKKELKLELLASLMEQFKIRIKPENKQVQKTHIIKKIRRNIARIRTKLVEISKKENKN